MEMLQGPQHALAGTPSSGPDSDCDLAKEVTESDEVGGYRIQDGWRQRLPQCALPQTSWQLEILSKIL